KYGAFSSIGSDENYDRRSSISGFVRDDSKTTNYSNGSAYIFYGRMPLDEDLIYEYEGSQIFLPRDKTTLAAVQIDLDTNEKIKVIRGVFIYQDKQYFIPIRNYYWNNATDLGGGLDAGVFIMPRLAQTEQGDAIEQNGALLYLSPKVVHSQLARLYLYGQETDAFKAVHVEPSPLIQEIRNRGIEIGEFILAEDFIGPIKIWEITYPRDIEFKPEYLETKYPERLSITK
ncbi:MAG: hypothetical protein AABY16_02795, partial [Nanoarchaeota archaeon]